jgi:uncharacterized spore protein YtfJ
MKEPDRLFESVAPKLEALVRSNAVLGPTTTVGTRHAIPLVELSLGLGGGGGLGEGDDPKTGTRGKGHGGAAAGGAKVTPVAVLVIDGDRVQLQPLGH